MPRIAVVGSLNMDLVVRAPHLPAPGETVIGRGFTTAPGGKGANQALLENSRWLPGMQSLTGNRRMTADL